MPMAAMTDEELIKRLLDWSESDEGKINDTREVAADRIEEYARAFANLQREYDARGEQIAKLERSLEVAVQTVAESGRLRGQAEARADLAQAPAPVRVKPLEWAHKVKMQSGNLEVRTQDDGRVEFFTHCGLYTIRDRGTQEAPMYILRRLAAPIMGSAKLSELYEAAQRDHAARIMAALEAPDAGVAELVEAAERVADQDAKPEHPGRYAELRQTIHGLRAALAKLGVR